jgi:hypothetical protein
LHLRGIIECIYHLFHSRDNVLPLVNCTAHPNFLSSLSNIFLTHTESALDELFTLKSLTLESRVTPHEKENPSLGNRKRLPRKLDIPQRPSLTTHRIHRENRQPYYRGNLNAALQDLMHKALAEQEFVLSHISAVRTQPANWK